MDQLPWCWFFCKFNMQYQNSYALLRSLHTFQVKVCFADSLKPGLSNFVLFFLYHWQFHIIRLLWSIFLIWFNLQLEQLTVFYDLYLLSYSVICPHGLKHFNLSIQALSFGQQNVGRKHSIRLKFDVSTLWIWRLQFFTF